MKVIEDEYNRQKAEIEEQEAEINRLNYLLQCYALEYGTVVDKERVLKSARAEAVKEFAERLKEECGNVARMEFGGFTYFCVGYEFFDNLVKEFTEGEDD